MAMGQDRTTCPDCGTVVQRKNIPYHYRRLHPGLDPVKRMKEVERGASRPGRGLKTSDIAGMVLAVLAVFVIVAAGVLFFTMIREGESKGREPRAFFFAAEDGAVINGTFYPAPETDAPTVFLFHDIGQDRTVFSRFAPGLVEKGYNVVALDLRGHGGSTYSIKSPTVRYDYTMMGHTDFLGFQKDLWGAYRWVHGSDEDGDLNTDAGEECSYIGLGRGGLFGMGQAVKMSRNRLMSAVIVSPTLDCYNLDVAQTAEDWGSARPILFAGSEGDGNSMAAIDVMMGRREENGQELILKGTLSSEDVISDPTLLEQADEVIKLGMGI